MCKFFSAIIMRDGTMICDPEHTDSHEDLIDANNLHDGGTALYQERFARIEFTPPEDHAKIEDLTAWKFRVDEDAKPSWLDEKDARERCEARVSRMFFRGEAKILLGGCWILVGNSKVVKICGSKIKIMYGTSSVGTMCGTSSVGTMWGTSSVGEMRETSSVGTMRETSSVGTMRDESKSPRDPKVRK